ncbi:LemA family protein [Mycoplasma sp. NEAQ87857]|uniref:LemA family protein n=1 Tax=Mycoplasma sp. NEAQ87857 TaxID=2683967 RepID=UPI001317B792|nr:LemA family protein [Mycoplasma sp. NEAQ87857]QGZ97669.1 LemA family protein [Mycoplasma sp. NEAQ87857]
MANLYNQEEVKKPQGTNIEVDNTIVSAKCGTIGKVVWYASWILIIPMIINVVIKNKLMRMQNEVNQAASLIDTQLQKRYDTLNKLVKQVASYKEFEKSTYEQITKLRKLTDSGQTALNSAEIESLNSSVFGRLIAVAENYPDLKSSNLYQQLMEESTYIEREIAAARRLYNSKVQSFNSSLFTWPSNVIACAMCLTTLPYFQASTTAKQDVSMDGLN